MKRMKALLLSMLAPVVMSGVSPALAANSSGPVTLTYADVNTPDSIQGKAEALFAANVAKLSHGAITIKLYMSGSLYGQDNSLPAMEQGQLDMTSISAATAGTQVPSAGMFESAYMFKNYLTMMKVWHGPIGKQVFQTVAKQMGVVPLDAWYLGSREMNYRNIGHDILTPADMKGVKFRVPDATAWINMGHALGANPVPLAFSQVYTAIQTGTVDAQDNPLPTDLTSDFYQVAKNISLTNHVIDSIWPAINAKVWNSLTPQDRAIILKAIQDAGKYMDAQTLSKEHSLITYFEKQGVKVVTPNVNAFYSYAQKWYKSNPSATQGWNMKWYAEVQAIDKKAK